MWHACPFYFHHDENHTWPFLFSGAYNLKFRKENLSLNAFQLASFYKEYFKNRHNHLSSVQTGKVDDTVSVTHLAYFQIASKK